MIMSKVFLLVDDDADDKELFIEALSVVAPGFCAIMPVMEKKPLRIK